VVHAGQIHRFAWAVKLSPAKEGKMAEIARMQNTLQELRNAIIVDFCVDLKHRSLKLGLEIPYVDPHQSVDLTFGGVASFYYVDGDNASRRRRPDWDFVELTEVIFRPGEDIITLRNISKERKPTYETCANFVIDIWSSASLYIEAEDISIDGRKTTIGYPPCPDPSQ
jgi:hypothetical protein